MKNRGKLFQLKLWLAKKDDTNLWALVSMSLNNRSCICFVRKIDSNNPTFGRNIPYPWIGQYCECIYSSFSPAGNYGTQEISIMDNHSFYHLFPLLQKLSDPHPAKTSLSRKSLNRRVYFELFPQLQLCVSYVNTDIFALKCFHFPALVPKFRDGNGICKIL